MVMGVVPETKPPYLRRLGFSSSWRVVRDRGVSQAHVALQWATEYVLENPTNFAFP